MPDQTPLNPDALQAAAKAIATPDRLVDGEFVNDIAQNYWTSDARVAVSAYLAALPTERPSLMSGPRFSIDELRRIRGIVESGMPLARNTVLRLIESVFMEVNN